MPKPWTSKDVADWYESQRGLTGHGRGRHLHQSHPVTPLEWDVGKGHLGTAARHYSSTRKALRNARRYADQLAVLKDVPGQKKRKQILTEGLMDSLSQAEYYRKEARHWRAEGLRRRKATKTRSRR